MQKNSMQNGIYWAVDKMLPHIIKTVVLVAVAIISVWMTDDFLGAVIASLTFLATIDIDAWSLFKRSKKLDLSSFVIVCQILFFVFAVCVSIAAIVMIVIVPKYGCEITGYHVWMPLGLGAFVVVSCWLEIMASFKEED